MILKYEYNEECRRVVYVARVSYEIGSSHCGDYEEHCILGPDAMFYFMLLDDFRLLDYIMSDN
jgi:hypothetical protein